MKSRKNMSFNSENYINILVLGVIVHYVDRPIESCMGLITRYIKIARGKVCIIA